MRLADHQISALKHLASELAGDDARLYVFGSRLDDSRRGGDLDLMLELSAPADNPALLAARFSARASRIVDGRSVDVLLSAPGLLRLPIHDIAFQDGRRL